MSAVYSIVYPDRVQVLTDGGFFDADGILRGIGNKVVIYRFPLAVAPRGADSVKIAAVLKELDAWLTAYNPHRNVDHALIVIEQYLTQLEKRDGPFDAEFLVAAYSESRGPCHFLVHCHGRYEFPTFRLNDTGSREIQLGPTVGYDDIVSVGLTAAELQDPEFLALHGAAFMGLVRAKEGLDHSSGRMLFLTGGRADLTTLNADGATTRTLCEWPDEIGKPIDPTLKARLL